jgi:hypothetical protein
VHLPAGRYRHPITVRNGIPSTAADRARYPG